MARIPKVPVTFPSVAEVERLLRQPSTIPNLSDEDVLRFFLASFTADNTRGELTAAIATLYKQFESRYPLEDRLSLVSDAGEMIQRGVLPIDVLHPYIFVDSEASVVTTATMEFVRFAQMGDGDPLGAAKYLAHIAGVGRNAQRVGILSGLLLLGDERTCALVEPWKDRLTSDEVFALAAADSGFLSHARVEFWLRWLEARAPGLNDGIFGSIAGHLYRMPERCFVPKVDAIEMLLPGPEFKTVKSWTVSEYAERIAPRLLAVARREQEPKLGLSILESWRRSSA